MSEPPRKTDMVIEHMRQGRWTAALRIAHKFRLGLSCEQKADLQRAHHCSYAEGIRFHRQVGRDPKQLIARGQQVLHDMYGDRL